MMSKCNSPIVKFHRFRVNLLQKALIGNVHLILVGPVLGSTAALGEQVEIPLIEIDMDVNRKNQCHQ